MPRMFLFAKHAAEEKIGGKKRGQADLLFIEGEVAVC